MTKKLEFGRRQFLGGAGSLAATAGLAGAGLLKLGGCSSAGHYTTPPATAPAGKELRSLNFDLAHSLPDEEHYVEVWGKKYKLDRHTTETLSQFKAESPEIAAYATVRPPTHFSAPLPFPTDALQTFSVYRTSPRHKIPQFVLGAIHVPDATMWTHHNRAAEGTEPLMLTRKNTLAGINGPEQSYEDFCRLMDAHDITSAAIWVCFHHPEVCSLDPEVASKILGFISEAGGMSELETAIGTLGSATTPEESGEYQGWANGYYLTAPDGSPIRDEDGTQMWELRVHPDVLAAAGKVVVEVLNRIRNDQSLIGLRYTIQSGKHVEVVAGTEKDSSPACLGSALKFKDPNRWNGGAKITQDSFDHDTGTVKFTVHNDYFRYLGVYVGFFDANGGLLKLKDIGGGKLTVDGTSSAVPGLSDYDNFKYLGLVSDRMRILGIPILDESSESWSIQLPPEAASFEVYAGTLANSYKGEFAHLASDPYARLAHVGAITTGLIDLFVPSLGLAAGIGGVILTRLKSDLTPVLDFFAFAIATAVSTGVLAANGMHGEAGTNAIVKVVWWFLTMIGNIASKVFAAELSKLLARLGETSIWKFISKKLASAAGEAAAQESVPIAGQILYAINIAGSLAEIAETVADVCLASPVQNWRADRTHDIHVTVAHDKNNTQFPAVADKMVISYFFSDGPAKTKEARVLQATDLLTPTMDDVLCGVPEGGTVTIMVQYLSANNWIAGQAVTKVDNFTAAGQTRLEVALQIEEKLVPLDADTQYSSSMRLGYASGRRQWINDTVGPSKTVSAKECSSSGNSLCAPTSITVCSRYGQVGYTWKAAGAGVAGCPGQGAAGTQLYLAQNVNFSGDINRGDPESVLMLDPCGTNLPSFLAYDLKGDWNGNHYFIDPSTGKNHLRKLQLVKNGSFQTGSCGIFTTGAIRAVGIHTSGYACALNESGHKVEILRLPEQAFADDTTAEAYLATQVSGPGRNFGNILGGVALAPAPTGTGFIVLEHTNRRLQCFDRAGQPVMDFFVDPTLATGRSSVAPLKTPNDNATYVDIAVEATGYIYVLGYVGTGATKDDYFMDIYQATGGWLARTSAFAAAKLTVDLWRTVWTLDWDSYVTADNRTEPVVRRWIPSTPSAT